MNTILIRVATGQLGRAMVSKLLQRVKEKNISLLVRDFAKAEDLKAKSVNVLQGNYNMMQAKQKLTTTNLSISEIAYHLGFEHPQSFNKLFKSKVSSSPSEFKGFV